MQLPTREEMLANADAEVERAYAALEEAGAWLRSDWTPAGSVLTDEQARRRNQLREAITRAKTAIDNGRNY